MDRRDNGKSSVRDRLDRPLRDLRVSVTDRCNFRCTYCMPRELFGPEHTFLDRDEILSFEEIARAVRVAAHLGVSKVRLTGGEPLVRNELPTLVAMLADIDGIDDLAMTTNGSLLAPVADQLATAGLNRVTVSLDALDQSTFQAISDTNVPLDRVLESIDAAVGAGLEPVKVNAVVKWGVNEHAITDLARFARDAPVVVRFIEYMDVGTTNGWCLDDVVPATDILDRVASVAPVEPIPARYEGEVANRYRYVDGAGEIGIVASVTQPFCGDCTRARLSAVGEVYTCLFASGGSDLRELLRGAATDAELEAFLRGVWAGRTDRYSELRSGATRELPKVEMSYIGG